MKLLLLAIAANATTAIQAQEVGNLDKAQLLERALQFKMKGKDTVPQSAVKIFVEKLRDGRVRILPQDGMPSILPNTSDIAAIPNAYKPDSSKDPQPGRIPNGFKTPRPTPYFKGSK